MNTNVIIPTNNPNGTTTYRIPALIMWWTTNKAEAEAMVARYNETGSWEDRGNK